MKKVLLKDDWLLRSEELSCGPEMFPVVLERKDGWLRTSIPCDVHMPLIESGIIKEPLEGDNFLYCNWIEDKSWWFRKEFNVGEQLMSENTIEIVMEALDSEADIIFNNIHLGHHKSAFYPFRKEVKQYLRSGMNTLLIRVTSGLEHVSQQDLALIRDCVSTEVEQDRDNTNTRGDKRRAFVRKPQYAYGWDWGPRVATCGIMKDIYLESSSRCTIRNIHAVTKEIGETSSLSFEIEVENLHPYSTEEALIDLDICYGGIKIKEYEVEYLLRSGINYIEIDAVIDNPKLWWPNGMGNQELYTAGVSIKSDDQLLSRSEARFGIRKVKLVQDRINKEERQFTFEINGIKVFSKGSNWIPADSIYGRITDEKYEKLVLEAKNANFNMLRVWGGGLYERDIFYDKCDEYGIMLWHDFMFACSKYPDNLEWFNVEVTKEMDYQTKRLRNHPSLVLWCGNNENHTGFHSWWNNKTNSDFFGGANCYNILAPSIVRNNCPELPYWNSSPYGGEDPNGNNIGDKHYWGEAMMNSDMEKRITPEEYDTVTAKFVSEYGYVGPCKMSSILRYHGDKPVCRGSEIWNHHNNTFEKDTVEAGIRKHYRDTKNLSLEKYLLYAELCQGLMYGYSLEALRFKANCSGGMFWMYSDCWGEVGWTIIDYYLRRKASYYFVKRAYEPLKFIMRDVNGEIKVVGINDTPETITLPVEYGYISFDGKIKDSCFSEMSLNPYSREILLKFSKTSFDCRKGVYFIKPTSEKHHILPAVLRTGTFKELDLPETAPYKQDFRINGNTARFTVKSDFYVHAVHFNLAEDTLASDEYFDLLPGESRTIYLYNVPEGLKETEIRLKWVE